MHDVNLQFLDPQTDQSITHVQVIGTLLLQIERITIAPSINIDFVYNYPRIETVSGTQ